MTLATTPQLEDINVFGGMGIDCASGSGIVEAHWSVGGTEYVFWDGLWFIACNTLVYWMVQLA